jgi:hypothetical protein
VLLKSKAKIMKILLMALLALICFNSQAQVYYHAGRNKQHTQPAPDTIANDGYYTPHFDNNVFNSNIILGVKNDTIVVWRLVVDTTVVQQSLYSTIGKPLETNVHYLKLFEVRDLSDSAVGWSTQDQFKFVLPKHVKYLLREVAKSIDGVVVAWQGVDLPRSWVVVECQTLSNPSWETLLLLPRQAHKPNIFESFYEATY